MRAPVVPHCLHRGLEPGLAAGARACPVQYFLERGGMRFLDQLGEQVFLERLAGLRGAPAERRMYVFGNVLDLDARHVRSVAPFRRHSMRSGGVGSGGESPSDATADAQFRPNIFRLNRFTTKPENPVILAFGTRVVLVMTAPPVVEST